MARKDKLRGPFRTKIHAYLVEHPHSTAEEISEGLGVSYKLVGGTLSNMRQAGWIVTTSRKYPAEVKRPGGILSPSCTYAPLTTRTRYPVRVRPKDLPRYEELMQNLAEGETVTPASALAALPPTPAASALNAAHKRIQDLNIQIYKLRDKVVTLEVWKDKAVRKHPDLGLDPVVQRAREIVAMQRPDKADRILAGAWDQSDPMVCTVAALRSFTNQGDVA